MSKHFNRIRFLPSITRLTAALPILMVSLSAAASEGTMQQIASSVTTREQVRQELVQAQAENRHLSRGQGSESDAFELVRQRSRKEVREQALSASHGPLQRELFSGG